MINKIKDNKKEIIIFIVVFLMTIINYAILDNFNGDNYYNYGFSYNIVKGMIPYGDFNMVLFPFSAMFYAFLMFVFGEKLIIYYSISSIIVASCILLIRKIDKSLTIVILFLFLLVPTSGYNLLSIFLFVILFIMEKRKSNSYFVGIILSLLILTNQKMVIVLIPALLNRNLKENIKLIKGIIIPIEIVLLYLNWNNAFCDFMNYAVLGLFDFGSSNSDFNLLFVMIEVIIILTLLVKYLKTKDIRALYCLCFQIITIPIMDYYHVIFGLIIYVMYTCSNTGKMLRITNILFVILIFLILSSKAYNIFESRDIFYLNTNQDNNTYMTLNSKETNNMIISLYDYYYENIDEYDIYFIWNDSYYAKIYMDVEVNKFDLILNGNNGYNGNEKLKEKISSMNNVLFIIYEYEDTGMAYDQTNYEIIDFVKDNYKRVDNLGNNFYVYEIIN